MSQFSTHDLCLLVSCLLTHSYSHLPLTNFLAAGKSAGQWESGNQHWGWSSTNHPLEIPSGSCFQWSRADACSESSAILLPSDLGTGLKGGPGPWYTWDRDNVLRGDHQKRGGGAGYAFRGSSSLTVFLEEG